MFWIGLKHQLEYKKTIIEEMYRKFTEHEEHSQHNHNNPVSHRYECKYLYRLSVCIYDDDNDDNGNDFLWLLCLCITADDHFSIAILLNEWKLLMSSGELKTAKRV